MIYNNEANYGSDDN